MKFTAVAFDLDGTLYPNFRLFMRLVPFFVKEQRLLRAMGAARTRLRKSGDYGGDFYELQARIMGEILRQPAEKIKEKTERLIYRGWEPLFKKIKLFPHVKETLDTFREKGIKLGLLSDFPPEIKLENLNLGGYWDTVACSEHSGRLKPDPASFLELSRRMEVPAADILFVGNSVSYDIQGARLAGMKTALIRPKWKGRFTAGSSVWAPGAISGTRETAANVPETIGARGAANAPGAAGVQGTANDVPDAAAGARTGQSSPPEGNSRPSAASRRYVPDFVFYDYRQLCDYVLG